jgi:hypothetical protein
MPAAKQAKSQYIGKLIFSFHFSLCCIAIISTELNPRKELVQPSPLTNSLKGVKEGLMPLLKIFSPFP